MTTRPDDTGMPGKVPATDDGPRFENPDRDRTGEPGGMDDERHRRVRRRQMIGAILAILAIIVFALIQGFLGAPSKIPGTH
ncbi:hypothetical protein [Actinocatenispora thailandica]|nr:hypothetical protein [Actinocatenispora thailandica]